LANFFLYFLKGLIAGYSQGYRKAIAGYSQGYRKAITGYSRGYRKAIAGYSQGYRKAITGYSRGYRKAIEKAKWPAKVLFLHQLRGTRYFIKMKRII
jgi:hypothetical protein